MACSRWFGNGSWLLDITGVARSLRRRIKRPPRCEDYAAPPGDRTVHCRRSGACRVIISMAQSTRLVTPWRVRFQGAENRNSTGGPPPAKRPLNAQMNLGRIGAFLSAYEGDTRFGGFPPYSRFDSPTVPSRKRAVMGTRQGRWHRNRADGFAI